MILVADSGSTKTDWLQASSDGAFSTQTKGYNPFHVSTQFIENDLKTSAELGEKRQSVSHVFFYGAGCSSLERNMIVKKALVSFFDKAEVYVEHDLIAAARALFGESSGVCAIMGTGSNVCYYNGNEVFNDIPALGFILGDEGGGSNMGQRFMKLYLNKQLPTELNALFKDYIKLTLNEILDRLYRGDRPNEFLASIVPFLKENMHDDWVYKCVRSSIDEFFKIYVSHFADRSTSLGIVGSIGTVFAQDIEDCASNYGFHVTRFLKKPIEALCEYHNARV